MNTTDVIPLIDKPNQEYYEQQASALLESCRSIHTDSVKHIRKYHPEPDKLTQLNKPDTNFGIGDAREVVAREHGFATWSDLLMHIEALGDPGSPVSKFEQAVEAIVTGNLGQLDSLINEDPDIVHAQSSRGHRATLLHYVSANGIENFRQLTPPNALDIAELLLSAGALPDALAEVYESKWGTALELVVSSYPPARAGLQSDLAGKLIDYGAAVDGIRGNGAPLLTAIYFHYPNTAETLVARGAKLDNIVAAAAMGDVARVAEYLGDNGKLRDGAPLVDVEWLHVAKTAEANLGLAFVWAAMLNRADTVRYMLEKGVSPASKDHRDWTALHWAGFYACEEVVDLLLAYKAPLEARNEYGGTVLDQTLWATAHEGAHTHHINVVQKLVDAGARIHSWWLLSDLHPPLDERVAKILEAKV